MVVFTADNIAGGGGPLQRVLGAILLALMSPNARAAGSKIDEFQPTRSPAEQTQ